MPSEDPRAQGRCSSKARLFGGPDSFPSSSTSIGGPHCGPGHRQTAPNKGCFHLSITRAATGNMRAMRPASKKASTPWATDTHVCTDGVGTGHPALLHTEARGQLSTRTERGTFFLTCSLTHSSTPRLHTPLENCTECLMEGLGGGWSAHSRPSSSGPRLPGKRARTSGTAGPSQVGEGASRAGMQV